MGSVNVVNNKIDQTVQIVDKFYGYQQVVAVDEYDAVVSYFKSVFGTGEAAGNFAVSVFRAVSYTHLTLPTILRV